jgi:hypothetical protein
MYVYKKTDKKKENPIHLSEGVRFKTLYNKADKLRAEMEAIRKTLMFQGEDYETRKHLYKAIDCINAFQDNLKLKDNIENPYTWILPKVLGSGDKCPYCKEGRLLLADTFSGFDFEVDPEPYEAGKTDKLSGEEIRLNDSIHLNIVACDSCKKIIDAHIDEMFYNDEVKKKLKKKQKRVELIIK